MVKIKPNKADQAFKQVEAFEQEHQLKSGILTDKIPGTINKLDSVNHYHVIMIKQRHDSSKKRYVASLTVQTYSKGPAFDKIAKNYAIFGFSSIVILHDPKENKSVEEVVLQGHEITAIEAKVKADQEAEMKRKIAEGIKAGVDKALKAKEEAVKAEKNTDDSAKIMDGDVEVTESNIDEFAKDNKVDVSKASSVDEKLSIVKKFIDKKK